MKKRVSYSSSFSFFSYVSLTLLSFSLQQSDASKRFVEEEITDRPTKMRKVLASSKELQTCYGDLNILSEDILTHHILPKCNSNIIKVDRTFFTLVTGYSFKHILEQGFQRQPTGLVCCIISNSVINFKNLSQDIQQIPSFVWYSLIREVKNISPKYWFHLKESHIQKVNLNLNKINDKNICELGQSLIGTQVRALSLSCNYITAKGAYILGKSLPGTQIQTLNLSHNEIGVEGARALSKFLLGTQVQTLDLSFNHIGDEGTYMLVQSLPGTQVQTLYLSLNHIGGEGVRALSQSLKKTQVQTLDLSFNRIGDEEARTLIQSLKGTQIQTLDLSSNQIDEIEKQNFKIDLKNTHIQLII